MTLQQLAEFQALLVGLRDSFPRSSTAWTAVEDQLQGTQALELILEGDESSLA